MLTQSVMIVTFVLDQFISQGNYTIVNGRKVPTFVRIWNTLESATVTIQIGNFLSGTR